MSGKRWNALGERLLEGDALSVDEARSVLESSDDDILALTDAAFILRRHYFGRRVVLHVLRNARSGHCAEDCAYCSQSARSKAPIERYPLQSPDAIAQGAREAHAMRARRYCIVTGGRAPSDADIESLCATTRRIKEEMPIDICVSLGLLTAAQALRLRAAGVNRYNHNLETSAGYFPSICATHDWRDRMDTVRAVKSAGLELCSGGIVGMGETLDDRIELAFSLKEADADSVPVNFFTPRPGTPFESVRPLGAYDALRALVMFRFALPSREIRIGAGRERCLGPFQSLSLFVADSLFTAGYLTTPGQGYEADVAMIESAGFYVSEQD